MTMAVSPEDALTGFQARAQTDPTLRQLLGVRPSGNARIEEGFPTGLLGPDGTPLATYFLVSDVEIRPGIYTVRIQVDIFVWPSGTNGGGARRKAIDDRMLALFSEQHWLEKDSSLYAISLAGRNFPAEADEALRKTRDWQIQVSPA